MDTTNPDKATGRHKKNCECGACVARNRLKEAIASSARDGGDVTVVIPREAALNADFPDVVRPKDKQRQIIVKWLELRAANPQLKHSELAEQLGMGEKALRALINRSVREGWLKFEDPISRLEHEVIPKVVDNLAYLMDKKDPKATIEIAKGTIFKQYAQSNGIVENPVTVLALKIEPSDASGARIFNGVVVGKAREIEE